ncbi:MAG TPA: hypothetical protein VGE46_07835 [Bdellovibrio sp.]
MILKICAFIAAFIGIVLMNPGLAHSSGASLKRVAIQQSIP